MEEGDINEIKIESARDDKTSNPELISDKTSENKNSGDVNKELNKTKRGLKKMSKEIFTKYEKVILSNEDLRLLKAQIKEEYKIKHKTNKRQLEHYK